MEYWLAGRPRRKPREVKEQHYQKTPGERVQPLDLMAWEELKGKVIPNPQETKAPVLQKETPVPEHARKRRKHDRHESGHDDATTLSPSITQETGDIRR